MEIFLLYLIVIAIILICLTVHELGHFFAASFFHVNVKEISIGIGPRLFSWKTKGSVIVSLRLLPIMAYVMTDSHALRDLYKDSPEEKQYHFYMGKIPNGKILVEDTAYWQYVIIMLAGVFMNLLLFFIFWPICHTIIVDFIDPFTQLGKSLSIMGYNMVFLQSPYGSGSIFGQIIDIAGETNTTQWALTFLNLFTMMNLMLTILNLVPFPPLDGYKAVGATYTRLTNKPISFKAETIMSCICFFILIYIFVSSIIVDFL